ncbi:MAG: site-specific integrase [Candidatus Melainabacteria bacterium]|nr:site-specific integrase [Candidatus Melainabacteria bacterium]
MFNFRKHRDYLDAWGNAMANGLIDGRPFSLETLKKYVGYMTWFLEKHGQLSIKTLVLEMGSIGVEHFAKKNDLYQAAVCFAKYLILEGALPASFMDDLKKRKLKPKRHRPPKRISVKEADIQRLINSCKNKLDRLILILLASTGLRASEACGLTIGDLDFEEDRIVIRLAKWGKTRKVGISPGLKMALEEYLKKRGALSSEAPLLVNGVGVPLDRHGLRKRLYKLGQRVGVIVSPHALRRAFVTINVNHGIPLVHLQIACGHSDIRTTRSYTCTSEDEVVEAMKSRFTNFY